MLIGYRRSSTSDQVAGYEAQEVQLRATGCTRIFGEMTSSLAQRDQLDAALEFVREDDVLVVCKIDRLARSTTDLLKIVAILEAKRVSLRILDFGGTEVDTKSPTGRMLLTMFGAVAEWELATMRSRQKVGVAKAKAEGRYRGRQPTARRKTAQVQELQASGARPGEIAARLGISRSSVYRILSEAA
ncbi:recombinase family protein [Novosphingobium sp. ERN07]|uniref:recombinase family protein n=1 Tax=Novosphingobium sp. ERN07 TaxID=2726187 RepID=UPI00145713DA|nr:recombinase family protein [Novosphingobium sp. ERN07]NLR71188.1 recombinase family protein [Novosphingobium sp. ERN07]